MLFCSFAFLIGNMVICKVLSDSISATIEFYLEILE